MPRLTEYLLKLATDTRALDEYRSHGHKEAAIDLKSYLTQQPGPGLTPEQAEALASRDPERIRRAVKDELTAECSHPNLMAEGLSFSVIAEVHHIQLSTVT